MLLLERDKLTSGSTWHAAGLVGQLRTSANITQLLGYSVALYDRLEAETGPRHRLEDERRPAPRLQRRALDRGQAPGDDRALLRPRDAAPDAARRRRTLWPLMQVDDVVGAAFLPTDGQASPSDITQALAKGARQARRHASARTSRSPASSVEGGRVAGGRHRPGPDRLREASCICAGQWSRAARRAWPASTCRWSRVQHQYLITEPIDGVTPDLPTLRDPDRLTYYKEEVGGLVMGGYEPNPKPWADDGLPERFDFQLLENDSTISSR